MFKRNTLFLLSCCFFSGLFVMGQPYTVQGMVLDTSHQPVTPATLILIYDSGLQMQTLTKADGSFDFTNLPAGMATCYLYPNPNSQVISPPCGFYRFEVSEEPFLDFTESNQTTGVVLTFGSPSGGGTNRPSTSGSVEIFLNIHGLQSYLPQLVDKIVVTGFWHFATVGTFQTPIPGVGLIPLPGFSNINFVETELPQGRVKYQIIGSQWDPLTQNGPMATLNLGLPEFAGTYNPPEGYLIQFCQETLLVYSKGVLIDTIFNHRWLGMVPSD